MILSPKIQDAKRLRLANIQEERMVTGAIKNKVDKIIADSKSPIIKREENL